RLSCQRENTTITTPSTTTTRTAEEYTNGFFKRDLGSETGSDAMRMLREGRSYCNQNHLDANSRKKANHVLLARAGEKISSKVIHFAAWANSRQVTSLMFCSRTNARNSSLVK